jgi:hypothetical protein
VCQADASGLQLGPLIPAPRVTETLKASSNSVVFSTKLGCSSPGD